MVRALAWTARGAGSSPAQSTTLFTKVTLVVSKKFNYISIKKQMIIYI